MTYVILDGETKVAALGNSDGYPSGVGAGMLHFLSNRRNVEALKACVGTVRPLTERKRKELRERDGDRWEDAYIRYHPDYMILYGADLLSEIVMREGECAFPEFGGDRRLDEWAYLVDLDRMTFEVYEGWNRERPTLPGERFHGEPDEEGYHPLREVAVYGLDDLPSLPEFVRDCEKKEPE